MKRPVTPPGDEAATKLRRAEADAHEKLRRAEGPAAAMLEQAQADAEEKLRRAEGPAEAMLEQALVDADEKLRRAEGPAEAMLEQARIDAGEKLRRAEGPAEAKLGQALLDADEKLRRAEDRAQVKLQQALIDAGATLRRAEVAAKTTLAEARIDADEKLRDAQEELARQREVFERFFTLSLDMMCIVSPDGRFQRVSPAFSALGYTDEDLLSQPYLDFVHSDDVPATVAEAEKLARHLPTPRFDNRYRCKDGSYRWLSWTVAPDSAGTLYGIARDVTEIKRTQQALASAKTAADVVNRELESFSYSVAHDLRAPLRSIDGFSQAILEDCSEQLNEDGRKYLRFVRESAQLMAQLIDDLLTLSRVARQDLDRSAVDLSALAELACARLAKSSPGRRVQVTIQAGIVSRGDARLLTVLFDNLLGNSWKFSEKRESACIEFGVSTQDGVPVYFVRDNGAGFDMAYVGKLFGAFQRLHAISEFEGTGVGLATVQRIVHRHGGRIWAEGAIDIGATFYFTLDESEPRA